MNAFATSPITYILPLLIKILFGKPILTQKVDQKSVQSTKKTNFSLKHEVSRCVQFDDKLCTQKKELAAF